MILLLVTNPPPEVMSPLINSHPQSIFKPKQVPPGSVPHSPHRLPAPQAAMFQDRCWSSQSLGSARPHLLSLGGCCSPHPTQALLQGQEGPRRVHGAILGPALPLSLPLACFSIIRQLIARWDGIDGCASVTGIYFESFEVSAASSRSSQQGEAGASNLFCLLLFQMSLIIKCLWNGGGK